MWDLAAGFDDGLDPKKARTGVDDIFERLDSGQVHVGKRRVAELGTAEVGTAEVGTAEVGTGEVGTAEFGIAEVGTAEVGTAEVGTAGQIYRTSGSHGPVARRLVRGAARRMALQSRGAEPEAEILRGWASKPELAAHAGTALEALEADPPDLVALSTSLDAIVTEPTSRVPRP